MSASQVIRVLVVEDDEKDFVLIRDMLLQDCRQAFDVERRDDLEAAVAALAEGRYNVCLVDHHMLGSATGLELLRAAGDTGRKMPIILLTGRGEEEVERDAWHLDAADTLVKGEIVAPLLERAIRYAIERKRSESQIADMAYRDDLTGLPNRALFMEFLSAVHARNQRSGSCFGLLFLDLDMFKTVNDSLGHAAGDDLLKQVAERLRVALRQPDMLCRIGGDEFSVILDGLDHPENAALAAQRILDALETPFLVEGQEVFVSGSIGISTYPESGDSTGTLVKNADMAMYRAKASGRNKYTFHTAEMMTAAAERLDMERSLRRGLEEGRFILHYQPQVELMAGKLVGCEALVRMTHPEKGMIPPDRFIPVAEETGLICALGEWVLRTACRQNVAWAKQGLPPFRVAVNLSARQFQQKDLVATVRQALEDTGLSPDLLELELTEGQLAEDAEQSIRTLTALKDMGVRLAIDDFGTGYSSLGYLKRFPVDTLKIDRSFVRDVITDPDDAAIATAIIGLGRHLRLESVAEGVEGPAQYAFLRAQGCDVIQGYMISKPLPAGEFPDWLFNYEPSLRARAG